MLSSPQPPDRIAFGPFTVDATADELLRGGMRIRLPGQPFQILLLLLARPGEVVSREQLREKIWLEGTFVDFDHGLNAAINKLRRALGDSADKPRYIETIPNRGYRFIGRLEEPPLERRGLGVRRGDAAAEQSEARESRESGESRPEHLASSGIHALSPLESSVRQVEVEPLSPQPPTAPRRLPGLDLILAGIGLLVVAGGIWLVRARPVAAPLATVQFTIAPPPGAIFTPPIAKKSFAISPDGRRLAFIVIGSAHPGIWIRDLDSAELRPLAGTEGAWSLFWSPDSRSILYSVRRAVKEVNLETSSIRTVAAVSMMAMHGSWRADDDLVLYLSPTVSYEVSTRTGAAVVREDANMRWAEFLPGSDDFLHVTYDPALSHYRAVATNFKTHRSTPLMEIDSRIEYAPPLHLGDSGHLLFVRGGSLLAQPFDAASLRLTGEAFPLAQNVTHFSPSATACFSVSNNGVLVYQLGSPASELRWYDRTGRVVSVATPGRTPSGPLSGAVRIAPNGESVAAQLWSPESGGADVWVFDRNGRESRRLTYPPMVHSRVVWSPDRGRIAFASSRTGAPRLAVINSDGSGNEQSLVAGPVAGPAAGGGGVDQIQIPTDWSRDGRFIVFDDSLGEEERSVWLLDVATRKTMRLIHSGSSQWGAAFSPDGRQVAFLSDESGRPEAYLQGFEALPVPHLTGPRRQISHESAWLVRWRPDGREIFYVGLDAGLDARLYAGQIAASGAHGVGGLVGEAKALFRIAGDPQSGTASDFQFDVSKDGQQFAMTTVASTVPSDFVVVQNWQTRFHP